jgi:pimeloyl-ACP methyl ester carboxylesterase
VTEGAIVRRSTTLVSTTAIAAALLLASCSSGPAPAGTSHGDPVTADEMAAPPAPERPTEAVDRLVPVGAHGARMHLTCTGSGSETVLLISGFGDDGSSWSAVADGLVGRARVCVPVRFGLGTSDAPDQVQTFASEADALHDVLEAAGEPGPYVLVGHSFGGAEAVSFADRHPEGVAGLVLVDASPTDWPARTCAVPDDGSEAAASFAQTCTMVSDPEQNPERLDGVLAFAQVAGIGSLGDLPLGIVSRADVVYPGLAPGAAQVLAMAWARGQDRWAALSTDASVVEVDRTGHVIQIDRPDVVIDQIDRLLG